MEDFLPAPLFPHRPHEPPVLYHGHRRSSYIAEDIDELVEVRARQRTFDGAYMRTALGSYGYALVILKVFSSEFSKIGLCYVILATLLLLISWRRWKRSDADFADQFRPPSQPGGPRIWGREFHTSGDVVVLMLIVVTATYAALFALIMRLA